MWFFSLIISLHGLFRALHLKRNENRMSVTNRSINNLLSESCAFIFVLILGLFSVIYFSFYKL